MFVLNELEKILQSFATTRRPGGQTSIALADIERVDVDAMKLASKVNLHTIDINGALRDEADDLDWLRGRKDSLTTDTLFINTMKTLLLDRLTQMPVRAYPSARILICDQRSLQLLAKLQCLSRKKSPKDPSGLFINRQPYNVTAIFNLDDIVDTLDRLGRPLLKAKSPGGSQTATLDYTIVRQVFPFLRITDLAVVLNEIGNLRLGTFTIDGKREHQVVQFLTHFARSAQLIESQSISKLLGQQHPTYDNVSILKPHLEAPTTKSPPKTPEVHFSRRFIANNHLTPQLSHLSFIANRLVRLVQQLGWSLESITFRAGDPTGFSKIFSQILDSLLKYDLKRRANQQQPRAKDGPSDLSIVPVRVLVLDRYFDMQGLLRHADLYGSFVDQETARTPDGRPSQQTGLIDDLDEKLRFERLTDALGATLRISSDATAATTIAFNQAVRKHLDIIKTMYQTLNEGYLLLMKLEASVESSLDTMRNLTQKFDHKDQAEFAERFKRIGEAFKQLVAAGGSSIRVSDAIRFACILIDGISVYLFINPDTPANKSLVDLKSELVFGNEFRLSLKAISDARGNDLDAIEGDEDNADNKQRPGRGARQNLDARLGDFLDMFDAISSERCATRSLLTLEETIEHFYKRQLEAGSYPSLKLSSPPTTGLVKSSARNKIVVLMLGSISHDELNRIKALEKKLMSAKLVGAAPDQKGTDSGHFLQGDILTMASDLIRPDEFIRSL